MNWIFLALIAPGLDAIINFIDKYIVSNQVRDYRALPVYTSIIGFIAGIVFWIIFGNPHLNFNESFVVLLTGVLQVWALVTYFNALSRDDTSKLIIFFKLTPVLILILSYFFLKETLTLKQIIGFSLIFGAVISTSIKKADKFIAFSYPFLLILITVFFWAASAVLAKFAINANTLSKILSYESWGIALGGALLYFFSPSIRSSFHKSLKVINKKTLTALTINECLFVLSKTVSFAAYALGNVALVSILGGTQVFYGVALGYILTKTNPKIFSEDISMTNLKSKILAGIILLLGIFFIT